MATLGMFSFIFTERDKDEHRAAAQGCRRSTKSPEIRPFDDGVEDRTGLIAAPVRFAGGKPWEGSMEINRIGMLALVLATAVLTGCATSRSEVTLATPTAMAGAKSPPNGKTIVIREVRDERTFEQAPAEPSTPSMGSAGSSDAERGRAVARKRNSFGQGMGDVLLQDGATVVGVVRQNITAAFEHAGYKVVPAGSTASPAPTTVDVSIKKFWALSFNSNIETIMSPVGGGTPTTVSVSVSESRQLGTDAAWIDIVQKALGDYRAQAVTKLTGPPF